MSNRRTNLSASSASALSPIAPKRTKTSVHPGGIGSSSGINRSPLSSSVNETSAEYLEAVKVLNAATMTRACELLLLDDEDTDGKNESELQLLESYFKCNAALNIVSAAQKQQQQQHQGRRMPPGVPNLTSLSSLKKNIGSNSNNHPPPAHRRGGSNASVVLKSGVVPMRRTTKIPAVNRMMNRSSGNDESAGSGTVAIPAATAVPVVSKGPASTMHPHKKARTEIGTELVSGSSSSSPSKNVVTKSKATSTSATTSRNRVDPTAPPPEALNFLAKLNKDESSSSSVQSKNKDDVNNRKESTTDSSSPQKKRTRQSMNSEK